MEKMGMEKSDEASGRRERKPVENKREGKRLEGKKLKAKS